MSDIINTEEKFSANFQAKVLASLFVDPGFLEQIYDMIDYAVFDSNTNQWIAKFIIDYYKQYHSTPSVDAAAYEIKKIKDKGQREVVIRGFKSVLDFFEAPDLRYIQDNIVQFLQNRKLKRAIVKSAELLSMGDYDAIRDTMSGAMHAGMVRDLGLSYKVDNLADRYLGYKQNAIATPYDVINRELDGGLAPGELAFVAALPGIGKSWFLQAIGAHALRSGLNVAHYTLELFEDFTGIRYDSILSGIPFRECRYRQQEVREIIGAMKLGQLQIKYYPNGSANIHTIYAHLKQLEREFVPDVIIIDYAEEMAATVTKGFESSYHLSGTIYQQLKRMAGELKKPVWTASQINRLGYNEDVIDGDKLAESLKKLMLADFVISISCTKDDNEEKSAKFYIMKNRFGESYNLYYADFDASNGHIVIHDKNAERGIALAAKLSRKAEMRRQELTEKYGNVKLKR